MRKCGNCGGTGHNARTCTNKKTEPMKPLQVVVPKENERLEKVKHAVALQNIGEKNLAVEVKENVVPDKVVDDPSFWDHEQRKLISRELRKHRDQVKGDALEFRPPAYPPEQFLPGQSGYTKQLEEAMEDLGSETEIDCEADEELEEVLEGER